MIGDLWGRSVANNAEVRQDFEAYLAELREDCHRQMEGGHDPVKWFQLQGQIVALDNILAFLSLKQKDREAMEEFNRQSNARR